MTGGTLVTTGGKGYPVQVTNGVTELNSGPTLDGIPFDVSGTAKGDLLYNNGSDWVNLAVGTTGQVLTVASGAPSWASGGGGGAVSSVSNSDGSLTVSPTTGAVVASLALGHANTWSALQTFGTNLSFMGEQVSGTITAGALVSNGTNWVAKGPNLSNARSSYSSFTSNSAVWFGLGAAGLTITPTGSGTVKVSVYGHATCTTATGLAEVEYLGIYYNSGTAPAQGTSTITGTQLSPTQATYTKFGSVTGAEELTATWKLEGYIAGLSVGTTYWFDVQVEQITSLATFNLAAGAVAQEVN